MPSSLDEFFSEQQWWTQPRATRDRDWHGRHEDLTNALQAWRTNPICRRIVNLTRDHVWGAGIYPTSKVRTVQRWLDEWWYHPLNDMPARIQTWIDALTLDGEIFPTFHTDPATGMTLIRALAASQVEEIRWRSNDYEQITAIGQRVPGQVDLVWWPSITEAQPDQSAAWHYAINRQVGTIRGEGDITPILPWLAYYSDWLAARVKRGNALSKFYYEVVMRNADEVPDARRRYAAPPEDGSVVVHSDAEEHRVQQPHIGADDARADGIAIRTMLAVGGNVPIHWLSEPGEGNSEATSNNMNDVSYRHYATRQGVIRRMIEHCARTAYYRAAALGAVRYFRDPQITTNRPDISKSDNEKLARAARDIAEAFATWRTAQIDDETITRIIFKFAGEDLSAEEVTRILRRPQPPQQP